MSARRGLKPDSSKGAISTDKRIHRRSFLKGMVAGGVVLTTGGLVAERLLSTRGSIDPQRAYMRDVLAGDRAMKEREYVLMSESEKRRLIAFFEENYKKGSGE